MLAVWALLAAVVAAIFATYARVPPGELYSVSGEGLAGGASRALIAVNWPGALVALAVLGLVGDRLRAPLLAVPAALLCVLIVVPGVIDQADLDAKWINALPAIGVGVALALTLAALRRGGIGARGDSTGDRVRIAVIAALALISIPWFPAELGFYVSDVPGLGALFLGEEEYRGEAAVHLGEHHGFVGFQLVVVSLLLLRQLPNVRARRLRAGLVVYLSGLTCYGVGNVVNDAWLEQVVKRGWTSWEIPSVTRPSLTWMWLVVLAGTAAVSLVLLRRDRLA